MKAHPMASEGELFRKVLGLEWQSLHPDIQTRFEHNPEPGKPLRYQGELSELRCSWFGKLMGLIRWMRQTWPQPTNRFLT